MANIKINSESSPHRFEFDSNMHALISFRAIVGGLLIAMLAMIGLIGLGLAVGGMGLDEGTSPKSMGVFTGVWFIVSVLISLFAGSYFAARVSKFRTGRVGSAQGLVIASLFLGFFLYQTFSMIGAAGSAAGSFLGKSGSAIISGVQQASHNPTISNTINERMEDALGDLNLRSEPKVVAQGLASRLIRGDVEGAKTYLSRQSDISVAEADTRINQLQGQVDQFVSDAKEASATALRSTGWSLFFLVALGALVSIGGGALGSVANFRRPLIFRKDDYYPGGETV